MRSASYERSRFVFSRCRRVYECVEPLRVLADGLQIGSNAVIRVYDEAGNVIETHQHEGEFKRDEFLLRNPPQFR